MLGLQAAVVAALGIPVVHNHVLSIFLHSIHQTLALAWLVH